MREVEELRGRGDAEGVVYFVDVLRRLEDEWRGEGESESSGGEWECEEEEEGGHFEEAEAKEGFVWRFVGVAACLW